MSVVIGNCGTCFYWNRIHPTSGKCGKIAGVQSLTLLEALTAAAVVDTIDLDPRLGTRAWFGCTLWERLEPGEAAGNEETDNVA